jgi:hypothetical protein
MARPDTWRRGVYVPAATLDRLVARGRGSAGRAGVFRRIGVSPQHAIENFDGRGGLLIVADPRERTHLRHLAAQYRDLGGWPQEDLNRILGRVTGAYDLVADPDERAQIRRSLSGSRGVQGRAGRAGTREGRESFRPAFRARMPEAVAAIEAELRKMLPRDVSLRLVERIRSQFGEEIVASWQPWERIVSVALAEGTDVARIKGVHEAAGHVLRDLYTDAEWKILLDKANEVDAPAKVHPGMAIVARYRKMYTSQLRQAGLSGERLRARVEERLDQERVAALAELWAAGQDFGPRVNALLARILRFLEAVRNALNGLGFQTWEDVFERVERGEVAARRDREVAARREEDPPQFAAGPPGTDVGKTLRANLLEVVWRALEAGDTEPRPPPFPAALFQAAKAERDKGRIKTREEFDRWAEKWKGWSDWKTAKDTDNDPPRTLADWLRNLGPFSK